MLDLWDGKTDPTLSEVWAPAPGFESNYMVSSMGRLVRIDNGRGVNFKEGQLYRFKAAAPNTKGYLKADLYKDGERKTKRIHLLVLEAFRGPAPEDKYGVHEGHHINADKTDVRLVNLEWRSAKTNAEDRWHRYYTKGENVR